MMYTKDNNQRYLFQRSYKPMSTEGVKISHNLLRMISLSVLLLVSREETADNHHHVFADACR